MKIFIDSSMLIAALISPQGGSAKILELCEAGLVEGHISKQVIYEITRVIERKLPALGPHFSRLLKITALKILPIVSKNLIRKASMWISDKNDAPVLAAAKFLRVDYLLTLDIRHFIKDPAVAKKSGVKIMSPGDFLKISIF